MPRLSFLDSISRSGSNALTLLQQMSESLDTRSRGFVSLVWGYATVLDVAPIRSALDNTYVLIKADLDLPGACKHAQTNLLTHLRNENIFSSEFSACFSDESMLNIMDSDPTQVVSIKKILVALHHLERCLEDINRLDARPERNIISYSADLIITLMSSIAPVIKELNSLHQSSAEIEVFCGDLINPLVSKLNKFVASVSTNDFSKAQNQSLSFAMRQLQEDKTSEGNQGLEKLSQLIFQLPEYFQTLQKWIDPASLKTLVQDEPEIRQQKTEAFLKSIEKLSTSSSTSIRSSMSTINLLLNHLPSLINTAGPASKIAHSKLEQLLNQLRYVDFPEILAELESLEERFSLRQNILIEPSLKAMNELYTTIAKLPELLEKTSVGMDAVATNLSTPSVKIFRRILGNTQDVSMSNKIDHAEGLEDMCDDLFIEVLQNTRMHRWSEAAALSNDMTTVRAVDHFFTATLIWSTVDMDNIPSYVIEDIRNSYKTIQPYYAALYPEMDVIFVNDMSSWFKKNVVLLENDIVKSSVMSLVTHDMRQADFKRQLIQNSSDNRDGLYRSTRKAVSESVEEAPPELTDFNSNKNKKIRDNYFEQINSTERIHLIAPLHAIGDQLKYKPPIERILSLKVSDTLKNFMENELKHWAETSLEPDLFQKLTFDHQHIPASVVSQREVLLYKDTPTAMLYKKLIFVLDTLQKNIAKLELSYDQMIVKRESDPLFLMDEMDVLDILLFKNPFENLDYVSEFLTDIRNSPQLSVITRQALAFLAPLENIPVLGSYIQSMHGQQLDRNDVNTADIVARWEQERELVRRTLAGEAVEAVEAVAVEPVRLPTEDVIEIIPPQPEPLESTQEVSITQKIVQKLYEIPGLLRKLNTEIQDDSELSQEDAGEKVSALLKQINLDLYDPKTLNRVFSRISDLTNILATIDMEARSIALAALKKTCGEIGLELMFLTDEAEYQFFFQSGTLSNPLNNAFHDFHRGLIKSLPIPIEEKIELIGGLHLLEHRIERGKAQSIEAEEASVTLRSKMTNDLRVLYQSLREMKQEGTHGQPDFSLRETQEKFLRVYQGLQPYLHQIKPSYNQTGFLRRLKTASDFKHYYDDVQSMKGKLFLLIEREKENNVQIMAHRNAHIDALKGSIESSQQETKRFLQTFKIDLQLESAFKSASSAFNDQLQRVKINSKDIQLEDTVISRLESMIQSSNAVYVEQTHERAGATDYSEDLSETIQSETQQLYSFYLLLLQRLVTLQRIELDISNVNSKTNDFKRKEIGYIRDKLLNNALSPESRIRDGALDLSDDVLALYEQLESMIMHVQTIDKDENKLIILNKMQELLSNRTTSIANRLEAVVSFGSEQPFQEILKTNSNLIFLEKIKGLGQCLSKLTYGIDKKMGSPQNDLNQRVASPDLPRSIVDRFKMSIKALGGALKCETEKPLTDKAKSTYWLK